MKKLISVLAVVSGTSMAFADGDIFLTQNVVPDVVVFGTVTCAFGDENQTKAQNTFYRSYVAPEDMTVQVIGIGIENAIFGPQPLRVGVYTDPDGGIPDPSTLELLTTQEVEIADGSFFLLDITLDDQPFVAGGETVVATIEIDGPGGVIPGFHLFPGSNNFGDTAPAYWTSTGDEGCGISVPITTDELSTLCEPDCAPFDLILNVTACAGGEPGCYADCNGDTVVNIFDFLCFQGLVTEGDPAADCNGDGPVNIFDFLCFQGAVTKGC